MKSNDEFTQPMYEPLAAISQDLILPGVETVPQNTISILRTNRRFMESYMLGLNDSLSGEALWRGAPVYLWSTFFRQFWDVRGLVDQGDDPELSKDITRLARWTAESALGSHDPRATPSEQAVLLVRGDLLKRYPNTLVYAIESQPGGLPALDEYCPTPPANPAKPVWPIFSGSLPPDLTFLGFDKTPTELCGGGPGNKGYYIVLEERLAEPRFGFDSLKAGEPVPALDQPTWWYDATWSNFKPEVSENTYIDDRAPEVPAFQTLKCGASSATVANICLQRPVRIAIHATKMLSRICGSETNVV